MLDSNIRTIAVRFSTAELRLLEDLAAAQEVDLEALIREALTLLPIDAQAGERHLQVVRGDSARAVVDWDRDHVLPSS